MKKLIVVAAILATAVPTTALGAAARKTSGVVYAGITHPEGKDLYVSGDLKDKILGRGAIVYTTRVRPGEAQGTFLVKARKIVIYTSKGSLTGKGQATQTIQGDKVTVTDGTFKLTKGTGKLKGHRMTGTFSGDQNDGVYKFTYKGKYK